MKKYIQYLTLFAFLVLASSTYAVNVGLLGGGAAGPAISDDFSSYAAADDHVTANGGPWDCYFCDVAHALCSSAVAHGDDDCGTVVDTINDEIDFPSGANNAFVLYYADTQLDTVNHYVAVQMVDEGGGTSFGIWFRGDPTEADPDGYVLRVDGSEDLVWRYCENGAGFDCQTITTCTADVVDGDSFGIEITLTGIDTVLKIYEWDVGGFPDGPPAQGTGDWNDGLICTEEDNPVKAADVGRYVGLYDGGGTALSIWTNFMAGDL